MLWSDATHPIHTIVISTGLPSTPRAHGGGYGRALLAFAEADVEARGGRLLLIETASHDAYAATIRFYERAGYDLLSRIPNYYKVGDDKLTFGKAFPTA